MNCTWTFDPESKKPQRRSGQVSLSIEICGLMGKIIVATEVVNEILEWSIIEQR